MLRSACLLAVGGIALTAVADAPAYSPDAPSIPGPTIEATGFFRICRDGDVWWMADPLGRRFLALGVDHATYSGFPSAVDGVCRYEKANDVKFGSREAWAADTVGRLRDWGFTMLGSGCDPDLRYRGLPHMAGMPLGLLFKDNGDPDRLIGRKLPNVYSPDFGPFCRERARQIAAGTRDDPWVVGYFLDNELCWYVKGGSPVGTGIYEGVLDLPDGHTAKKALAAFLSKRGHALGEDVPKAVREEFCRETAEIYFRTITGAIRAADPNHLVFSCRFEGFEGGDPYVWEIGGRYCDVMTLNIYPWADIDRKFVMTRGDSRGRPIKEEFDRYHALCGKPMFVSEWSFVAVDSGVDCLQGAGQRFRTQAERSYAAALFGMTMLGRPYLVGYDYFMWIDTPQGGIGGPHPNSESCNYGLVNERGEAYPVTKALRRLHGDLAEQHVRGGPAERRDLPETRFLTADRVRSALKGGAVRARIDGKAFVLSDGGALTASGTSGSPKLLESVRLGDRDVGCLSGSVNWRENGVDRWLPLSRVVGIRQSGRPGRLEVTAETAADREPRCRVTFGMSSVPQMSSLLVEVLKVERTGRADFTPRAIFLSAMSPFAAEKDEAVKERPMKNMWKGASKDGWFARDGRYFGALTFAKGVEHWKFVVREKDRVPQCDLAILLRADEPDCLPWTLLVAGDDGYAGWKVRSAEIESRLISE